MTLPFFTPRKITTEQHDRVPKEKYALFALSRLRFFKIATEHDVRYKRLELPLRYMHGLNDFGCTAVIIRFEWPDCFWN